MKKLFKYLTTIFAVSFAFLSASCSVFGMGLTDYKYSLSFFPEDCDGATAYVISLEDSSQEGYYYISNTYEIGKVNPGACLEGTLKLNNKTTAVAFKIISDNVNYKSDAFALKDYETKKIACEWWGNLSGYLGVNFSLATTVTSSMLNTGISYELSLPYRVFKINKSIADSFKFAIATETSNVKVVASSTLNEVLRYSTSAAKNVNSIYEVKNSDFTDDYYILVYRTNSSAASFNLYVQSGASDFEKEYYGFEMADAEEINGLVYFYHGSGTNSDANKKVLRCYDESTGLMPFLYEFEAPISCVRKSEITPELFVQLNNQKVYTFNTVTGNVKEVPVPEEYLNHHKIEICGSNIVMLSGDSYYDYYFSTYNYLTGESHKTTKNYSTYGVSFITNSKIFFSGKNYLQSLDISKDGTIADTSKIYTGIHSYTEQVGNKFANTVSNYEFYTYDPETDTFANVDKNGSEIKFSDKKYACAFDGKIFTIKTVDYKPEGSSVYDSNKKLVRCVTLQAWDDETLANINDATFVSSYYENQLGATVGENKELVWLAEGTQIFATEEAVYAAFYCRPSFDASTYTTEIVQIYPVPDTTVPSSSVKAVRDVFIEDLD